MVKEKRSARVSSVMKSVTSAKASASYSAAPSGSSSVPAASVMTAVVTPVTNEAAPPAEPASAPSTEPAADVAKPSTGFDSGSSSADMIDYTKLPSTLDGLFEELDEDSALRPTIINVGSVWHKRSQAKLLAPMSHEYLQTQEQKLAKNTCYDLLDALTSAFGDGRVGVPFATDDHPADSGAVSIDDATLHIVIASTHRFVHWRCVGVFSRTSRAASIKTS